MKSDVVEFMASKVLDVEYLPENIGETFSNLKSVDVLKTSVQ